MGVIFNRNLKFLLTKVVKSLSDLADLANRKTVVERLRYSKCPLSVELSFVNTAGFSKDACVSLLLGQVWYEQLTDKSKLYLKQLNKEIVQGVSKYDIQ